MSENNKKLVYEGQIFRVYEWDQEMFDGSFETFEKVVRRPSVQILVVKERKIMIYEEEQPGKGKYISLPGGMVDWDESFENGAKRELLEETGLVGDLVFFERQISGSVFEWETNYFILKNPIKIQEPKLDNGEKINSFYLSFEEFYEYTQRDDFRNKYFANFLKLKKLEGSLEEFKRLLEVD